MASPARSSAVEYEGRLFTIQGWIIEGVQSALIIKQVMAKEWAKSERHAKRMLAQARDKWIEHESDDVKQKRQLKILQLQHLARTLQERYKGTPEGIRAVMSVENKIIAMQGLAAPIKLEHTGADGKPIEIENKSLIDYDALSTDVLKAIINARKPEKI